MAYKGGLPLSKSINSVMLERRAVAIIGLVLLVAVLFFRLLPTKLTAEIQNLGAVLRSGLLATGIVCGPRVHYVFWIVLPARFQHFRLVMALAHLASDTRRLFSVHRRTRLHVIFWGVGRAREYGALRLLSGGPRWICR